jgi:hypothetical protein
VFEIKFLHLFDRLAENTSQESQYGLGTDFEFSDVETFNRYSKDVIKGLKLRGDVLWLLVNDKQQKTFGVDVVRLN